VSGDRVQVRYVLAANANAWYARHPDAWWAVKTFYFGDGDPERSQGWEDTSALLQLMLPPDCLNGKCDCQ